MKRQARRAGKMEARGQSEAPKEAEEPKSIRKGIYLSALIYIEGEQAPAEDFSPTAKDALKEALAKEPEGFSITLKKIEVKNDVEAEDEAKEPPKFEF